MSRGDIVKAGYLTKSPPERSARVAQWHRRWFVLADSRLAYPLAERCVRMEYFQSQEDAKKHKSPKGKCSRSVDKMPHGFFGKPT